MILCGRESYIIFSDYYISLCVFICHEDMGYLKILLLPKISHVILLSKKSINAQCFLCNVSHH